MMADLLIAPTLLGTLGVSLLVFGFVPGLVLSLIVRLIPDLDRRKELQAELYEVPRWERPYWVAEQFELALRTGLPDHLSWIWGRHIWHRSTLMSGLKQHLETPESFEVPSAEEKDPIRPHDSVKLMWSVAHLPGERMWVKVTERKGDRLIGTLDNYALFAYLKPDEKIKFHIDDIIDYMVADFEDEDELEAAY